MKREVVAEMLDGLSGDDPRAVRSRRDLRMINFLMGNERWIMRQVRTLGVKQVVEVGAGTGELTRKLAGEVGVTGLDFLDRPAGLSEVGWVRGDLFETLGGVEGETVVGNLILHHFQEKELRRLGEILRERERLILVEPWRSVLSLGEGAFLWPLVNEVTRHDMMVSIRAGFRKGELAEALGMGEKWEFREEVSLLGGIRVLGFRR